MSFVNSDLIHLLTTQPPKLHLTPNGLTSSWRLENAGLCYLDRALRPGMRTVETGAGTSTILFAAKGTAHTCVVPDAGLAERVRECCGELGIDHTTVEFAIAPSEQALPHLDHCDIDVALIDGRHGFPAPFLDWYYIAERMKIGGLLLLDDVGIWTCSTLFDFLRSEPDWQLTATRQIPEFAARSRIGEHGVCRPQGASVICDLRASRCQHCIN